MKETSTYRQLHQLASVNTSNIKYHSIQ